MTSEIKNRYRRVNQIYTPTHTHRGRQTGVCGQGNLIWQSGRNNSISDTTLFLLEEDPKQKSRRKSMLKKNLEKKGNPIHDVVSGNDELWRVVGVKEVEEDVKGATL